MSSPTPIVPVTSVTSVTSIDPVAPVAHEHLTALRHAVLGFDDCVDIAHRWGQQLAAVLPAGGRLLAAGNGGSAAQAQHLTAELVGRYREDRAPLSAICLSAETSSLTAIINDYPPDELFARQVQAHGRPGDVLVLMSTSGRSPNLVAAAVRGRRAGMRVWAFTGPLPNPLAAQADEVLAVDAPLTATVQELHLVALHIVCAALDATPSATAGEVTGQSVAGPSGPAQQPSPRRSGGSPVKGPLVVVGDALLDIDLVGRADRLCPDAAAPVVEDVVELARPGGAALAALLAAADCRDVVLVTPLADDEAGDRLRGLLEGRVAVVSLSGGGPTAVKRRILASGQALARLDSGGSGAGSGLDCQIGPLPPDLESLFQGASAVLVSDYGRGVTAVPQLRELLDRAGQHCPLVWDPHPRGAAPVPSARLVTPNRSEAAALAGRLDGGSEHLSSAAMSAPPARSVVAVAAGHADTLMRAWGVSAVAVTLGEAGALLSYGCGAPALVPAPPLGTVDTCGAGDRFAAAAATALGNGALTAEAVQYAVGAASRFLASGGVRRIPDPLQADNSRRAVQAADTELVGSAATGVTVCEAVRGRGGVVVATGGCFDLLHTGHIATLRDARQMGDCLIVCLNSDDSVRRQKGPQRPLVSERDRAQVLLALECVDSVVIFDEDTPAEILRQLQPDLWVKGGDYVGTDLPEAAVLARWGGQAVVLPYLPGRSTSRLVHSAAASGSSPQNLAVYVKTARSNSQA